MTILLCAIIGYAIGLTISVLAGPRIDQELFILALLMEAEEGDTLSARDVIVEADAHGVTLRAGIHHTLRKLEQRGLVTCKVVPSETSGPRSGRPVYQYRARTAEDYK